MKKAMVVLALALAGCAGTRSVQSVDPLPGHSGRQTQQWSGTLPQSPPRYGRVSHRAVPTPGSQSRNLAHQPEARRKEGQLGADDPHFRVLLQITNEFRN